MDPTTRVRLGTTSLQVTRLGLGTAPLGDLYEAVADDVAEATVTKAIDLGLGLVDTAPLYGSGSAERRVGRALASVDRSSVIVATKVGRLLRNVDGVGGEVSPVFDFSYDGVMRSVEESLERLGLDRIDILHIHDPDDHHDEGPARGVIGARGAAVGRTGSPG